MMKGSSLFMVLKIYVLIEEKEEGNLDMWLLAAVWKYYT